MSQVVEQVMAIMERAFEPRWGEAWNQPQVAGALTMPNTFALLIDKAGATLQDADETAVGFVLSRTAADEEELLLIGVLPEYRGMGIGRKLIEQLMTDARERGVAKIFLEMRHNNPAQSLYRQIGFEPIGQRANYYRMADGSRLDAITFALTLTSDDN